MLRLCRFICPAIDAPPMIGARVIQVQALRGLAIISQTIRSLANPPFGNNEPEVGMDPFLMNNVRRVQVFQETIVVRFPVLSQIILRRSSTE